MKLSQWLRRVLADWTEQSPAQDEQVAQECHRALEALRAAAALAVAQAQRTELELREAVAAEPHDEGHVAALVSRLEQDRQSASQQVAAFRQHRLQAAEALERLGDARQLEALNQQRERLREYVASTEATLDTERAAELEMQARAEAARLDVLDDLERGRVPTVTERTQASAVDRARELLAEKPPESLKP